MVLRKMLPVLMVTTAIGACLPLDAGADPKADDLVEALGFVQDSLASSEVKYRLAVAYGPPETPSKQAAENLARRAAARGRSVPQGFLDAVAKMDESCNVVFLYRAMAARQGVLRRLESTQLRLRVPIAETNPSSTESVMALLARASQGRAEWIQTIIDDGLDEAVIREDPDDPGSTRLELWPSGSRRFVWCPDPVDMYAGRKLGSIGRAEDCVVKEMDGVCVAHLEFGSGQRVEFAFTLKPEIKVLSTKSFAPDGALATEVRFDDFRSIGNVSFPYWIEERRYRYRGGEPELKTAIFLSIVEVDPFAQFPEDHFDIRELAEDHEVVRDRRRNR